ncbi:General alpha-glucoside permease [Cladobotryum mycophilum]|uniref:General alpha-glucoside permease n=1 Tax=Cladobotryum mycophilum TaxID=491253 RepID=A0ABR0SDT1_9HYPO
MASAAPPHDATDRPPGQQPLPTPEPSSLSTSQPPTPETGSVRNLSMDEPRERTSNEQSPLLAPTGNNNNNTSNDGWNQDGYDSSEHIDDSQTTKSLWYLTVLTIGIGGLQIAWSVELSNGSPYLLGLGLSKSLMALVWIAGPLTGTLVQPYIGMLSDSCRLPWGKRKPFMLGGTVATIVSLMFLAWAKEIVGGILSIFGADPESKGVKVTVIIAAVIGIYVLDFAINTVQAALRAFIVDCGPAHQQEAANSMASRMTGMGNILGFIAGYVNLTGPLWFFGNSQFKILCVIASLSLAATVILSSVTVKERDPRLEGPAPKKQPSVVAFFFTIFKSIKRLPPQIMRVCQVQFCGWVGFFPLLFYTSSYIGEIYVQPFLEENPHMSPAEIDKLYEEATRIGSFALLINSIVSLLTNVFLPFFVAPTYDNQLADSEKSFLDRLRIPGFTLKRAWFGSLILFSIVMVGTVFVRSINAAIFLIGVAGITWAITLWAPYAIISAEISRRDAMARANKRPQDARPIRQTSELDPSSDEDEPEEQVDQAGVIMGIHNMSISAPQILANVGSSLIFRIWQKPRGTPGDHSIGIVLALGGLFALASAFFVLRVKDDLTVPDVLPDEETGEDELPEGRSTKSGYEQVPTSSNERTGLRRSGSFGGLEVASGSDN